MKKFAVALATVVAVLGFGGVAQATSDDGYPPVQGDPSVSDPTPSGGDTVTVTVNCSPGESVTVTLSGVTAGAVCNESGSTDVDIVVPDVAGVFGGTVEGDDTGPLGTFTVTVSVETAPAGGLPATGSDGTSTTLWIAAGLLVLGLGLFGAAAMRRRQPTAL